MAVNKVVYGNTVVIDISSTTATASDVTLGERFYLADGQAAIGTHQEDPLEVHGGASVDGTTLILDESEGSTAAISVVDTPDTHGGTVRTITALNISDTTAVASDVAQGKYFYTAGGVKTAGTASGGGGTSATQHTIHLEFSDTTDMDLTLYYDDLVGSIITASKPETYNNKTVELAQLDGVTWYVRETWTTVYDGNPEAISDSPHNYFWISELSNVYPTVGSVWRVTVNNEEYRCTAVLNSVNGYVYVGNTFNQGDTSTIPVGFYNAGWGAWVGETTLATAHHSIKIEQLVT